ncbi:MAG: hypothetical protein ACE366_12435 [Bradymonadia bacterium]
MSDPVNLRSLDLNAHSPLTCRYAVRRDDDPAHPMVLVLEIEGEYRSGTEGNPDAAFIEAHALAGLARWSPCALVLDLQKLVFPWGNALLGVIQGIHRYMGTDDAEEAPDDEGSFPVIIVSAEHNRDALLALWGAPEPQAHWHFRTLQGALDDAAIRAGAWLDSE